MAPGHPARLPRGRPPRHRPRTAGRADRPLRPRPGRSDAGTTRPGARLGDVPPPAAGWLPPLRRPAPRRPGCRVARLLPHLTYACLRHGTWIGPPAVDHPAADLTRFPDIIDAQRRHLLVLRRYGWAATYDAVLTAWMLCGHIWFGDGRPFAGTSGVWDTWNDRLHHLVPLDQEKQNYVAYSTSRLFAAVYPEPSAWHPRSPRPAGEKRRRHHRTERPVLRRGRLTHHRPRQRPRPARRRRRALGPRRRLASTQPPLVDLHARPGPLHPPRHRREPARPR